MRKVPLITGKIYHIFNRGVNKGNIFLEGRDYQRFLDSLRHYKKRTSKFSYEKDFPASNDPGSLSKGLLIDRVEILAYCLMPNHVHMLLKQLSDNGLASFMQQLMSSFSHYINIKYRRTGPLFEGRFRNIAIETDEQLIHVSRYIHLNPLVSGIVSDLMNYPWSSYAEYVSNKEEVVSPGKILEYFKSNHDYEKFVNDQVKYGIELEKIKHITHD